MMSFVCLLLLTAVLGQNCIISEPATRVYGQLGSFTTNTANNGGVSADSLFQPKGVAFDTAGKLYVADPDNNRVLAYAPGSTTAFVVYGQQGSFATNAANTGGISTDSLAGPTSVAFDSAGNLYVADTGNNRALVYAPGSTTAFRVYGQQGSFTTNVENKGGVSASSLRFPFGVAVDNAGNVYIAEMGNSRVMVYAPGSTTAFRVYGQQGSFLTGSFNNFGVNANSLMSPVAVAFDSIGNVYVADGMNNRVLVYAPGSTTAFRVYGQLDSLSTNTTNKGGVTADSLAWARAIAVDNADNVYIVDEQNHRVLVYAPGSTTASRVYGQLGSFTTNTQNNGGVSANSLRSPQAVTVHAGNVHIVDTGNNRVLLLPCRCLANIISPTGVGPCTSICSSGTDAPIGSTSCTSCAGGLFNPTPGQTCQSCAAGHYSNSATGFVGCTACPPGSFSVANSASCSLCGSGTASAVTGATSPDTCQSCGVDTYADESGLTRCKPCASGTVAVQLGSVRCSTTSGGLSTGAIAGIAVGGILFVGGCVAAVYLLHRKWTSGAFHKGLDSDNPDHLYYKF